MLLIPQRYEFSSKSQLKISNALKPLGCCWYHKGTNFQANHNMLLLKESSCIVVADTTKVRIFKQITTLPIIGKLFEGCCWYHKGTNFQANHNISMPLLVKLIVVADTTKVRIFKQITTYSDKCLPYFLLLLIPQRYEFSSKSQQKEAQRFTFGVVADTTKVRIFKQITTVHSSPHCCCLLLLIPQRYEFSSKSQLINGVSCIRLRCCWYHKGTNFQANHNCLMYL